MEKEVIEAATLLEKDNDNDDNDVISKESEEFRKSMTAPFAISSVTTTDFTSNNNVAISSTSPDEVVASLNSILDIMTANNNNNSKNNYNNNGTVDSRTNDDTIVVDAGAGAIIDDTIVVDAVGAAAVIDTGINDDIANDNINEGSSDEDDYENLDLTFDDLYSDTEVEEYFVQQSPLLTQYAKQEQQRPSLTASSSLASFESSANQNHDVDIMNDLDVDDNDYYRLLSMISTETSGASGSDNGMDSAVAGMARKNDRIMVVSDANNTIDNFTDDMFGKMEMTKPSVKAAANDKQWMDDDEYSTNEDETYILGTLIVRVVAARGLASAHEYYNYNNNNSNPSTQDRNHRKNKSGGGFPFFFGGGGGSHDKDDRNNNVVGTNPYASVRFSSLKSSGKQLTQQQVQRTSIVFNTCNPVWPRGENMYMDVSHPMPAQAKKVTSENTTDDDPTATTETVTTSSLSSAISLKQDHQTADPKNQQRRHPGDPPLKAASNAAKANAKAAAKEIFLRSISMDVESKPNTGGKSSSSSSSSAAVLSPILSCALFHSPNQSSTKKLLRDDDDDSVDDLMKKKKNNVYGSTNNACRGDSDDWFLGMASLDLTPLLTGKIPIIDEWLPLSGGAASGIPAVGTSTRQQQHYLQQRSMSTSTMPSVRIICEYEPTDTSPQKGDYVQFTQFCHPSDLYPLMIGNDSNTMYEVEEVYNNGSYNSENYVLIVNKTLGDGWVSTFLVNRYMLIMCRERPPTVIEYFHDEIATHAERMYYSPLVHVIQETVHERVPENGLIPVGTQLVQDAVSTIFNRWLQDENCIQKVVDDLNYVTNWDGKHAVGVAESTTTNDVDCVSNEEARNTDATTRDENLSDGKNMMNLYDHNLLSDQQSLLSSQATSSSSSGAILPNMPSCPITGVPMRDPVVAADGHTYERAAIARWLQSNDRSPLTGSQLAHKNLVPNYMLLSSLQDFAAKASSAQVSAKSGRDGSTGEPKAPPPSSRESETGAGTTLSLSVKVANQTNINERSKDNINGTKKQNSNHDEENEEDRATTEVSIDD